MLKLVTVIFSSLFLCFWCQVVSKVGSSKIFSCLDSYSTLNTNSLVSVSSGDVTYYIGYRQVTSSNQDPIFAKFTGTTQSWCRTDYEVTDDDSTGYGIIYNSADDSLYGVFSSTGTQGTVNQDFRRFATKGWLTSYGSGGGSKVSIIAQIDPISGNVTRATFVTALLSDGKSNSVSATNFTGIGTDHLCIQLNSAYSPRTIRKTAYSCSGPSGFDWRLVLDKNLSTVISSCVKSGCTADIGCNEAISCVFQQTSSSISVVSSFFTLISLILIQVL